MRVPSLARRAGVTLLDGLRWILKRSASGTTTTSGTFAPMQAYRTEAAPIIEAAEGFQLIDVEGRRYLDGISSLWCNVHGHRVLEIDNAIRAQLDRVGHSTTLGLSRAPRSSWRSGWSTSSRRASRRSSTRTAATAVEVALKLAYQYQRQKRPAAAGPEPVRDGAGERITETRSAR